MPKRVVTPPREMQLELNITERLKDRVEVAAAYEGMSRDGYIERALISAVHETEKRASKDAAEFRDAKEYPYKCDYCPERFKLPMHRARHVTWSHPEMAAKEEDDAVHQDDEPVVNIDPAVKESIVATVKETVAELDPKFKLAPGMEDLMDEFEAKLADDVPTFD